MLAWYDKIILAALVFQVSCAWIGQFVGPVDLRRANDRYVQFLTANAVAFVVGYVGVCLLSTDWRVHLLAFLASVHLGNTRLVTLKEWKEGEALRKSENESKSGGTVSGRVVE